MKPYDIMAQCKIFATSATLSFGWMDGVGCSLTLPFTRSVTIAATVVCVMIVVFGCIFRLAHIRIQTSQNVYESDIVGFIRIFVRTEHSSINGIAYFSKTKNNRWRKVYTNIFTFEFSFFARKKVRTLFDFEIP